MFQEAGLPKKLCPDMFQTCCRHVSDMFRICFMCQEGWLREKECPEKFQTCFRRVGYRRNCALTCFRHVSDTFSDMCHGGGIQGNVAESACDFLTNRLSTNRLSSELPYDFRDFSIYRLLRVDGAAFFFFWRGQKWNNITGSFPPKNNICFGRHAPFKSVSQPAFLNQTIKNSFPFV